MRLFESDCPQQLMTEMRLQERKKRQEEVDCPSFCFFSSRISGKSAAYPEAFIFIGRKIVL